MSTICATFSKYLPDTNPSLIDVPLKYITLVHKSLLLLFGSEPSRIELVGIPINLLSFISGELLKLIPLSEVTLYKEQEFFSSIYVILDKFFLYIYIQLLLVR